MNKPCDTDEINSQFREQLANRMKNIEWPIMTLEQYKESVGNGKKIAVLDVRKVVDCCYVGPQHAGETVYSVPLKDFANGICDLPLADHDILVCLCVGGPMSAVAACMLRMLGFNNAYFLAGGLKALAAASDLDDPGAL